MWEYTSNKTTTQYILPLVEIPTPDELKSSITKKNIDKYFVSFANIIVKAMREGRKSTSIESNGNDGWLDSWPELFHLLEVMFLSKGWMLTSTLNKNVTTGREPQEYKADFYVIKWTPLEEKDDY
jgi:hypothetical protein